MDKLPAKKGNQNHCSNCMQLLMVCSCPNRKNLLLRKVLLSIGYILTAMIALGCGVSIAAAFIKLSILSGGAASYSIASLLFVAGTAINWLIYKNSVPTVLIGFFGEEELGQILFEVPGGCDLLKTEQDPTNLKTFRSPKRSSYIRYQNKLYFYNIHTHQCTELDVSDPNLQDFDTKMRMDQLALEGSRSLTYGEQQEINRITGHSLLSSKKKIAMVIGFFLALSAGIMQGLLTYGSTFTLSSAFSFLAVISPALPPIAAVLAIVTIISLTAVLLRNIANWVKTPEMMSVFKQYCRDLFDFKTAQCEFVATTEVPRADSLHELKLVYGRAYVQVKEALYYVDIGQNKCIRLDSSDVKKWALGNRQRILLSLEELSLLASLTDQPIKSKQQIILARALTLFFTLLALPLAALGVFMTMNASALATQAFLLRTIPSASILVVAVISKVLGLGLAFIGRIPFTCRNAIGTINHFLDLELEKRDIKAQQQAAKARGFSWRHLWADFKTATLYFLCFINAIGNGFIAMVGAGRTLGPEIGVVIGIAGTGNSLNAGVASGLLGGEDKKSKEHNQELEEKKPIEEKSPLPPRHPEQSVFSILSDDSSVSSSRRSQSSFALRTSADDSILQVSQHLQNRFPTFFYKSSGFDLKQEIIRQKQLSVPTSFSAFFSQ